MHHVNFVLLVTDDSMFVLRRFLITFVSDVFVRLHVRVHLVATGAFVVERAVVDENRISCCE